MSFGKAAQKIVPADVLAEYQEENALYSKACSEYTKLRILGNHPRATDEEIIAHARGLRVYKAACKRFNEARIKFITYARSLKVEAPTKADEEYLDVYEQTSFAATRRMQKESSLMEELESGKLDHMIEAAREHSSMRVSENENLNEEPPAGDFSPLD